MEKRIFHIQYTRKRLLNDRQGTDHDEDHDEGHEDHGEDMGTLANSDFETKTHRFGISKTGEWGYLGASYQDISYTAFCIILSHNAYEEDGDDDDAAAW